MGTDSDYQVIDLDELRAIPERRRMEDAAHDREVGRQWIATIKQRLVEQREKP